MASSPPLQLSVIVASHNRREMLRRCLDSLSNQTQDPASFEVVVGIDGSSDGTAEMAEALRTPFPLRVLLREKSGHANTQNAAIELAEAPTILLLDDDMIASPELVAEHIAGHAKGPIVGIGAIEQKPPPGRDWYAGMHANAWNRHYDEFERRPAHWTDCYGANLSMPREVLLEIGGVSPEVPTGKDLDLGFRLSQAGCVPTYLPRAHGVHDDGKHHQRMLADAERQAAMHVDLSVRHPEREESLLNWSERAGPKELVLRRALIALHLPPEPLARIGPLFPGPERQLLWYSVVRRFAFWRSARRKLSNGEWKRITGA